MAGEATIDWWAVEGEWVEPRNERRGGWSGVQRCVVDGQAYYIKRQSHHDFRSLRHPFGLPTLWREHRNLMRATRLGVPVPRVVFFDMRRDVQGYREAILVSAALDGYVSLEEGLQQQRWSPSQWSQILQTVGYALIPLHRAWRVHGHCYPKEIFVEEASLDPMASPADRSVLAGPVVAFVDWEVSRARLGMRACARKDLGRLWRSLSPHLPPAVMSALLVAYDRLKPDQFMRR